MKFLLDTHCWLWALHEPEKLNAKARKLIEDPGNVVFVSAATIWEMAIKVKLGKLKLPGDITSYVASRMKEDRYTELPITLAHAAKAGTLPDHHRDPFDRMLVAQALCEGMPLVTADTRLRAYAAKIIRAD